MDSSGIRYTSVRSARVAFETHGHGDLDIVYSPGLASHLDLTMEQPRYRRYVEHLCAYGRVIRFDRRGTGVSDPVPADCTENWEMWADDLSAVLDAVGSKQTVVLATNDAGPAGILFAATQPERTRALVLFNTTARFAAGPDYPEGHPPGAADFVVEVLRTVWGTEDSVAVLAPSLEADVSFRRWYARFQRAACPPAEMAENMARLFRMDARHVLPEVRCPTLVLHRERYGTVPPDQGRYLAEHIPRADFALLPGADAMIYTEDTQEILSRIGLFLGRAPQPVSGGDAFATVLFTDIVGSTDLAVALGDHAWHTLLDTHDALVRDVVAGEGGLLIKTTGDGVLATFDSPSRAIRCARAIGLRVLELGIEVRAGLHAGAIVRRPDGDVAGVAVHIAARVLAIAEPGEVLITAGVCDLLTADAMITTDRGAHRLKGIPEPQHIHAVVAA